MCVCVSVRVSMCVWVSVRWCSNVWMSVCVCIPVCECVKKHTLCVLVCCMWVRLGGGVAGFG